MNKKKLKDFFERDLEESANLYPFISKFWEINVLDKKKNIDNTINFGHYGTKNTNSYPFFKPFSKIVDFSKLDNEL